MPKVYCTIRCGLAGVGAPGMRPNLIGNALIRINMRLARLAVICLLKMHNNKR